MGCAWILPITVSPYSPSWSQMRKLKSREVQWLSQGCGKVKCAKDARQGSFTEKSMPATVVRCLLPHHLMSLLWCVHIWLCWHIVNTLSASTGSKHTCWPPMPGQEYYLSPSLEARPWFSTYSFPWHSVSACLVPFVFPAWTFSPLPSP